MKNIIFTLFLFSMIKTGAQSAVAYTVNFDNAIHHEATIAIEFRDLDTDTLDLTMSRSSPGRYALHEFMKNVYSLKAFNNMGEEVSAVRPNPYDWKIPVSGNYLKVTYTLFANYADGTYSDISESHAHLNMPATLIYAPSQRNKEHRITFETRKDLNWKIATQLAKENDHTYSAPDLDYLMDSPTELSDHDTRTTIIKKGDKEQRITFALHHNSTAEHFDAFFEKVKSIVSEEIAVFGEAPDYDMGQYTFIACYLPWVYGDGMEHRNSTILTSSLELTPENEARLLGTVAHEFFHAWNVERIRPVSLEPFDYRNANMSGALWFAEGFTSYYTNLTLKRAGIIDTEQYLTSITPTFNYVWGSPARAYFNPVEMSYQAPFVDAATSVDPVNRGNTFISYYSYGHMLGLALDLELRSMDKDLDGYFKILWSQYGKTERAYTLDNLKTTLGEYAGKTFAEGFFEAYIYGAERPDYQKLFRNMGVMIATDTNSPYFGAELTNNTITSYPIQGSPSYKAGLSKGDVIIKVNGVKANIKDQEAFLSMVKPKEEVTLEIARFGKIMNRKVTLGRSPVVTISTDPNAPAKAKKKRKQWLEKKKE
ncbi:M61 family metallopeptidase [Robertkochia sediminum]|uniref:M61 family metallopeptidase n=1 Tax=Robertkochia sediminum TaxID=2785326 RepID=UPI001931859C|nr:PDZ domain-containing protein [Robertkochia sediminum]MBL7471957.1 M61 family metallopeptidase [Robertkochia sediminum]